MWIISILSLIFIQRGDTSSGYQHERDVNLDVLKFSENYSPNDPPNSTTPLVIEFAVNLRNVLRIDEIEQILTLETSIRMYWKDERVSTLSKEPYVSFNTEFTENRFWIPDIFVDEAKDLRSPKYQLRPSSLRIYSDSTMRFSSRINFDVRCPMTFWKYPNDVQNCDIKLESFGYAADQILFRWRKQGKIPFRASPLNIGFVVFLNPFFQGNNVNRNITLPTFDVIVRMKDSYDTGYYSLKYPGISMKVNLKRKLTYHIIQTFIPSLTLVSAAWLSLFIPIEEIPGRVTMVTMSLVTLMALYGVIRKSVPKVSYLSLLDLWMFSCMGFVVSILIHYVVLSFAVSALSTNKTIADRINVIGIWCISLLFVIFNGIYWGILI